MRNKLIHLRLLQFFFTKANNVRHFSAFKDTIVLGVTKYVLMNVYLYSTVQIAYDFETVNICDFIESQIHIYNVNAIIQSMEEAH